MRVPAGMRQAAMDALPGLFLGLSTGALGDEGEPIDLVDEDGGGAGPSSAGAGPSGSGDRNAEPTDSDSDFEELTRDQFRANLAGPRINELVAPGLKVQKVTRGGKEMHGLFATRAALEPGAGAAVEPAAGKDRAELEHR